jgi:transposase
MGQRQRFTKEFKLEAVRLLKQSGRPAAEVARELGIPRNRLYKWAAQLEAHQDASFPGSGRQPAPAAELARLRREVARLTEERDILKKAAAYFAKDLP